jgi:hypothetical protein
MPLYLPVGRRVRRGLTVALAASLAVACGRGNSDEAARARREKAILDRQIPGLRELVELAEKGTLFAPDWLAIGIDEKLVQDLLAASLPQEQGIGERFKARLETAEVSFRGNQSLVTLRGRVGPKENPDTFADLTLMGGFDELKIDAGTGALTARVGLYHFEVQRAAAGGMQIGLVGSVVEELGRQRLDSLRDLVPPLQIPVRLESGFTIPGLGEGAVQMEAGELPFQLDVTRVVPLGGRLWVLIKATAGPWKATPAQPAGGGS